MSMHSQKEKEIVLHDRKLPLGNKTYVVGVINITPDSLGGGFYNNDKSAINHAHKLIEEGADIIEIGGESTRPGYAVLTDDEVINRISGVLPTIVKNVPVPISIDTYKSKVAEFSLSHGVHIVNDVSGLRADADMANVIKRYNSAVVICRTREKVDRFQNERGYMGQSVHAINQIIRENFLYALEQGITRDKIILDPRMGSGMTMDEQLLHTNDCVELLKNYEFFHIYGQPIMLAHSLKTFIGEILGNLPTQERYEGTDAVSAYAVMKRVDFLRVHNVKSTARVVKMLDYLVRR